MAKKTAIIKNVITLNTTDFGDLMLDTMKALRKGDISISEAKELNKTFQSYVSTMRAELAEHLVQSNRPPLNYIDVSPPKTNQDRF